MMKNKPYIFIIDILPIALMQTLGTAKTDWCQVRLGWKYLLYFTLPNQCHIYASKGQLISKANFIVLI